jgi:hypothetical protein
MKHFFFICLFVFVVHTVDAQAADWYVRPSGGTGAGTSWTAAWNNMGGINWSNVSPGDTIWVAGGSYSQTLNPTKNGASGKQITIRRVLVTDSVPTSAPGWSTSYASVATLSGGILINQHSYITIDGGEEYGFYVPVSSGGTGMRVASTSGTPCRSIYLYRTEIKGPGYQSVTSETDLYLAAEGGTPPVYDLIVSHCFFHQADTLIKTGGVDGMVIEYSKLWECSSGNLSTVHPDVWYSYTISNAVFRYNHVWKNEAEAVFFSYGGSDNISFYGNVFETFTGTAIEFRQDYTYGNIYIYNNTFYNSGGGVTFRGAVGSSSSVKNNIFWQCPLNANNASHDYNLYSGSSANGETHGVVGGSTNPFVNLAGRDFHIVATNGSAYPRDKGIYLGTPFDVDMDGVTRNKTPSIGAYEFKTIVGSVSPPSAPSSLMVQ